MAASTCPAAVYKTAPFMQHPAPADNIFELLSPVWWVMAGNSIGSYPFNTFWPQLISYVRKNGSAPAGGMIALCALMMLTLGFFVLWRFVRCVRVVCCQQESYADANKVLFSKRLRVAKGLTMALGLLACSFAAWGMISLNKNILPSLNARIDSIQEFPAKLVRQVDSLANETAALHKPLNNISSIISSVDVQGLRQDLQKVTSFLQEAPSPTDLKDTLQQLSTALKPDLYDGLRQLHAQVNLNSGLDSSPLATLKGYLDLLADFDMSSIGPAIQRYSNALTDLQKLVDSRRSDKEVQASAEFARVRSAFEQLDLDAWVPYVEQAVATANAVNAMRSPSTNPFTTTLVALSRVDRTIAEVRGNLLDSLASTVEQFNGLWHNNASVAFQSLLSRAARVNHTVLELPRDVESKLLLVNASVTDFKKLYQGEDSLLKLPAKINEAGDKLVMPDTSSMTAYLKAAEEQLNSANQLPELTTKLASLGRALSKSLRDAKRNIQPSLDAFAIDETVRVDLADTLTFELPVVQGVANLFAAASARGFAEYLSASRAKLDATIEPARRQAAAIPGVLQQINDFDIIANFMGPLKQAEAVYQKFGGKPANLTKPVFELLDRVANVSNSDLAKAQALVSNVSSSVRQMSSSIQSAALDKVDKFQTSYLGKKASASAQADQGADRLVHAVHTVYYVMLGCYAAVIALVLVLMLMTLLNCPAGLCISGFSLCSAIAAFSIIPLAITVGLLLMRDTCYNMEALTNKAVAQKAGNNSIPAAVSQFYLNSVPTSNANGTTLPEVIKGINSNYDLEGFKARVQRSVDDMLKGVTDDFTLRPQASRAVDDATTRINALLHSMDAVLLTLDHASVSNVYQEAKSFFCCSLINQVYTQWAATIIVVVFTWAAIQCALLVLHKLDTLSESCCRFKPYRSKDYGSGPGAGPITGFGSISSPRKGRAFWDRAAKSLQPMDSNSSDTVAVISLGGAPVHSTAQHAAPTAAATISTAPAVQVVQHSGSSGGVEAVKGEAAGGCKSSGAGADAAVITLVADSSAVERQAVVAQVPTSNNMQGEAPVVTPAGGNNNLEVSPLPQCTPLPAPLALRTFGAPVASTPPGRTAAAGTTRAATVPAPATAGAAAAAGAAHSHLSLSSRRPGQQRQQGSTQGSPQSPSQGSSTRSGYSSAASIRQAQLALRTQQQQAQQQPQRRPRVGEARPAISITAVYPSGSGRTSPASGRTSPTPAASANRQQQQQQQWGTSGSSGKGLIRAPATRP